MRISDWSSDVCSADLRRTRTAGKRPGAHARGPRRSRRRAAADAAEALRRGGRQRTLVHRYAQGRVAARDRDRERAESGESVSEREDLGGRCILKENKKV